MVDLIPSINSIRKVPHSELNTFVKNVAVILSAPRSGSSLLKDILAPHPDIAVLDGEIEPYLVLTENGFGYNSDSDAFSTVSNKAVLLDNIFDDLTVASEQFPPWAFITKRWERRLLLQFPSLFSQKATHEQLLYVLQKAAQDAIASGVREEKELQSFLLTRIFQREPWRLAFYDGYLDESKGAFSEPVKIEEPPFVVPRINRRSLTDNDARTYTLLFKTPPDVYRIGMYEQLFPNADIKYIHLTRGYAQSVNGLIDGWLSPVGFFSHDMAHHGVDLNIGGYSDIVSFGKRWWKFDLPPNWRKFTNSRLEEVCLHQWTSAHHAVLASKVPAFRIHFEEFLSSPSVAMEKITGYLGLKPLHLPEKLPVVMAVKTPEVSRWRKREAQLLEMGKRTEVGQLMHALGYDMEPETWL